MAHIKTVTVNAISDTPRGYYWNEKRFTTFTDDKGNETYYVNGQQVSKDEGNAIYVGMKASNQYWLNTKNGREYLERHKAPTVSTFKVVYDEADVTYEELIEKFEKSRDSYANYIDNYNQQMAAKEYNKSLDDKIAKLRKLIDER